MRHDYCREDLYCFSVAELEALVVQAEELDMPDWAYEELQELIKFAKEDGGSAYVKCSYGVKHGMATLTWHNVGSDEFSYWLYKQGERMVKGDG